jgi:hypothetical protein
MTQTICMMNFENKINRYSQTDLSSLIHLRQRFTQTSLVHLDNKSTQTNQESFIQTTNLTKGPCSIEIKNMNKVQDKRYQNKNLLYKGDQLDLNEISDVSFSGDYLSDQIAKCMKTNNLKY